MLTDNLEEYARDVVVFISQIDTPVGCMVICSLPAGICMLQFSDNQNLNRDLETLKNQLNSVLIVGENTHIKEAKVQLKEYFMKERCDFSVPLYMVGTPFQKSAWLALSSIPYGKTISYSEQALHIQRSSAVRAVAAANSRNKLPILLPCHRVIGKNGTLTGYAGGLNRKKFLLSLEGVYHGTL